MTNELMIERHVRNFREVVDEIDNEEVEDNRWTIKFQS